MYNIAGTQSRYKHHRTWSRWEPEDSFSGADGASENETKTGESTELRNGHNETKSKWHCLSP